MNATRPTRWYHKLCYRWSSPYRHDVEKGNKTYFELGCTVGWDKAMEYMREHMPWPYERTTDPIQQQVPLPIPRLCKLVASQEGGIHTRIMKAIKIVDMAKLQATGREQFAQLQARMREQERTDK